MGKALLFNPENDSALASGKACYTPSRGATALRTDGSLLPLWWAEEGDIVLSDKVEEGEDIKARFGLKGTISSLIPNEIESCEPWGWSLHTLDMLHKAGAQDNALPSPAAVERIRELSHRRTTIEINRRLKAAIPYANFPPLPTEIFGIESICDSDCPVYIKLPWSSSGRGVQLFEHIGEAERAKIAGMIRRQGSVMVEKALRRVADFAMLFHSDGQSVGYKGLSLFETDSRGGYTGNIVDTEPNLRQRLGQIIDLSLIDSISKALEQILTSLIASYYKGWMGVDMMVYDDGDARSVAPCVELNLRMTMGVVAHLLRSNPVIARLLPGVYTVGAERGEIDLCGSTPDSRFFFSLRRF